MTAHRVIDDHSELQNAGTVTHSELDAFVASTPWLIASGSAGPLPSGSINHESLNTLSHEYTENSYDVVTYGNYGITNHVIWTDASQITKLQETSVTYNAQRLITVVTSSAYNPNGTVKSRVIEAVSYDNRRRITNVTRTKVV